MKKAVSRFSFSLSIAICACALGLQPARALGQTHVEFHSVMMGDTWGLIAARYGVPLALVWRDNGVANPESLSAGQRLLIPTASSRLGQSRDEIVTISRGSEFLSRAVHSGYPATTSLLLNGIDSVSRARGAQVAIPFARPLAPANVASPPTPTPVTPTSGPPLVAARMGIQGYFGFDAIDMDFWLTRAQDAGFTWVKYQVSWKANEYPADIYPLMATLDAFLNNAERKKLNVLLSVVKAPDWARATSEGDGPPKDYMEYTSFMRLLANRYKGRLDTIQIAFEVWNEPNTRREWNGAPLSASDYVVLLSGAYVAVKAEDQRYTVISAGLAPTGINDGVIALDDREYLRQMYQAGLANVADAIGIHPYGWANPPGLQCCFDPKGPLVYDDNPRFFFLNTIEDYRAIQAEFGDSDLRDLWATEFGWPTMEGISAPVPDVSPWFAYVTPYQQAQYVRDAFLMTQDKDYMGPMFLWNLNMSTLINFDPDHAAYSVFLPPDKPRPAYDLIKNSPKIEHP